MKGKTVTDELEGIQKKAGELGKMISESAVFSSFKAAHEQLKNDSEARELLDRHEEIFLKLRQLEAEGQPIEPEDKHSLLEAQQKLHESKTLQDYAAAQADFQEMMNKLTDGIHSYINLPALHDGDEETEE